VCPRIYSRGNWAPLQRKRWIIFKRWGGVPRLNTRSGSPFKQGKTVTTSARWVRTGMKQQPQEKMIGRQLMTQPGKAIDSSTTEEEEKKGFWHLAGIRGARKFYRGGEALEVDAGGKGMGVKADRESDREGRTTHQWWDQGLTHLF